LYDALYTDFPRLTLNRLFLLFIFRRYDVDNAQCTLDAVVLGFFLEFKGTCTGLSVNIKRPSVTFTAPKFQPICAHLDLTVQPEIKAVKLPAL
jgi:hypothetical protein